MSIESTENIENIEKKDTENIGLAEETEDIDDDIRELDRLAELEADETDELRSIDGFEDEEIPNENSVDASDAEQDKTNETVETNETIEVIGVRFKSNGKIYYFAPAGFTLKNGDEVIVDTARGREFGTVCMPNRMIKSTEVVLPVREVVRLATTEDIERKKANDDLEINAFNTFIERIDAHGLTMKLIDVECAFDNSKLLFYFSADARIDFRELVRELAGIFHTRIELRQIGIRDEAKLLGGLGICGRPYCCSSFLSDFVQVSIKMAKEQNLSLNTSKISGACGRLMCCLRYEYESYLAEKAITPNVDAVVMTPDGEGVVKEANPLTGIVKVKLCGTADDEAPAVFVREDLVLKENYNGEKLTKTPVPQKHAANSVTASFEVNSPFTANDTSESSAESTSHEHTEAERRDNKNSKNGKNNKDNTGNNDSNGNGIRDKNVKEEKNKKEEPLGKPRRERNDKTPHPKTDTAFSQKFNIEPEEPKETSFENEDVGIELRGNRHKVNDRKNAKNKSYGKKQTKNNNRNKNTSGSSNSAQSVQNDIPSDECTPQAENNTRDRQKRGNFHKKHHSHASNENNENKNKTQTNIINPQPQATTENQSQQPKQISQKQSKQISQQHFKQPPQQRPKQASSEHQASDTQASTQSTSNAQSGEKKPYKHFYNKNRGKNHRPPNAKGGENGN